MSNPLRQQIEEMEPLRYARAAKRQAAVAKKLADKKGLQVSPRTQHLLDASEEQLAAEQQERLDARLETEASRRKPPVSPSTSNHPGTTSNAGTDPDGRLRPPVVPKRTLPADLLPWLPLTTPLAIAGWAEGSKSLMLRHRLSSIRNMLARSRALAFSTLEKGQHLASVDGSWEVHRRDDGHLEITVHNEEPWSTPVHDDDLVSVDVAKGSILVEATHPHAVWREEPFRPEHRHIHQFLPPGWWMQFVRITPASEVLHTPVISGAAWVRIENASDDEVRGVEVEQALEILAGVQNTPRPS